MNLNDLIKLRQGGECDTLEFKAELPKNATEVAQVLASFANSSGGRVLIGIEDNGDIVGIENPDLVMQRIVGIAQKSCRPPLQVDMSRLTLSEGKYIVCVNISALDKDLCWVEGRCYERQGPASVPIIDNCELERLQRRRGIRPFAEPRMTEVNPLPRPKGFKGRTDELRTLRSYLRNPRISIVIIEGISGIGKTALASKFAASLTKYDYFQAWIDCREETSLDSITAQMAEVCRRNGKDGAADALDDSRRSLGMRLERIAAKLQGIKLAIFLNDYHLMTDPGANELLKCVEERIDLTKIFITTSRRLELLSHLQAAGFAEEHLQDGLDKKACRAFLADCELHVSAAQAGRIWNLAGRGHPKALQIFVARARAAPVTKLISTLPAYQEALKKQWLEPLLQQLTISESKVVLDLCVFDRPINDHDLLLLFPSSDIHKIIRSLYDNFILEASNEGVHMHPLLRDFAFSSLQPAVQKRKHLWAADFYLRGQRADESTEPLSVKEVDVLLAGWYHRIRAEDNAGATEIVWRLRTTLMNRGDYEQLYRLLEDTPCSPEKFKDLFTIQKARVLHIWQRSDEAISMLSPILINSDHNLRREAILLLARIYTETTHASAAIELLQMHWQSLFAQLSSPGQSARLLERMVEAQLAAGFIEDAFRVAERMFVLGTERKDAVQSATAAFHLALCLKQKPDFLKTLEYSKQSAVLYAQNGHLRDSARAHLLTAQTHRELGQAELARASAETAVQIFAQIGDKNNKLECQELLRDLGDERHSTAAV
jgi:tetratricopeptide (TPR) repeat protein